ncbi:MAG: hypothetical protein A2X59_04520 [Nitrospirae bacterium GWC2_42_7]|nr:MAG: hypothetical protein A2X59_04520 [Nitrospirae bacterium GWC2_42_7]
MRSLVKPNTSPSPSSPPLKGGAILLPSPLEAYGSEPTAHRGEGEGALLMDSLKITRREFFSFFIIGAVLSLIGKKVRVGTKPQKARFWRKINEDKK